MRPAFRGLFQIKLVFGYNLLREVKVAVGSEKVGVLLIRGII